MSLVEGPPVSCSDFKSNQPAVAISSEELVPGDIIEVTSGLKLPCDIVLLSGRCVADESLLSGCAVGLENSPSHRGVISLPQEFPFAGTLLF
jgi:P-type E1-E2 ATPase